MMDFEALRLHVSDQRVFVQRWMAPIPEPSSVLKQGHGIAVDKQAPVVSLTPDSAV